MDVETSKEQGEQTSENPMTALANEKSFAEHMRDMKWEEIAEKMAPKINDDEIRLWVRNGYDEKEIREALEKDRARLKEIAGNQQAIVDEFAKTGFKLASKEWDVTLNYRGFHFGANIGTDQEMLYDGEKREAIEKIFVGDEDYLSKIENPDNLSKEERDKIREALEDMIEFGTVSLLNQDGRTIGVSEHNLFGRYLGEMSPIVDCRGLNVGIEHLKEWGRSETPEDLMSLFKKYGINPEDGGIRRKALNGFVRTLTCGYPSKRIDYDNDDGFAEVEALSPYGAWDDESPRENQQAGWYYSTFQLATLGEALGERAMKGDVEKYREQLPDYIYDVHEGELYHINAFDYCCDKFKEQHDIEGDLFGEQQ